MSQLVQGATASDFFDDMAESVSRKLKQCPKPTGGIKYFECPANIKKYTCENDGFQPVHFPKCGCACVGPWLQVNTAKGNPNCPQTGWYYPFHYKVCSSFKPKCKGGLVPYKDWECGCGCVDPTTPSPTVAGPTPYPVDNPTPKPTYQPSPSPTYKPSGKPTYKPSAEPTYKPSA
eukprot:CAMPEP_0202446410 /NCGR_PEP_ID=MMETSP1360-20130828/4900_1 /ASSEMBLY_ACC=CAM_ASM_000848 /TAXON_ID=515479 /ORGANISM="Licmophora paradoxa, Strain CCMP2313" /LENGTH=174 /DNA_ID=CAMNT_0049062871 /DNA_START=329 /DNA_END=850 /DNA_ORIENTATION=+